VVCTNLSLIASRQGWRRDALDHAERGLDVRRTIGAATGIGYALHDVASARQQLGQHRDQLV
jgi:hypothetical protein